MDLKNFDYKNSIHAMEKKDIKYLILHRGLMLNELELQYGEIYSSDFFEKVPEHTLIGMVMGGWIYRGTQEEVERARDSRLSPGTMAQKAINERDKEIQVKEIKKGRKANSDKGG